MLVRRMLARRLIQIAALSASAAGLHAVAGCSSGPTCGGPVGDPHQVCIDPSKVQGAKDGGAFENGCPTGELASEAIVQQDDEFGVEVQQGPTPQGKDCCYVVQDYGDCTGRPFLVGDRP